MHSLAFTIEKPDYTDPNHNKLHHVQNLLNTLETMCEKLYNTHTLCQVVVSKCNFSL